MSAVNGLHCFQVTSNLVLGPSNVVQRGEVTGARESSGAGVCHLPAHSLGQHVRHLVLVFVEPPGINLVDPVLGNNKELLTKNKILSLNTDK